MVCHARRVLIFLNGMTWRSRHASLIIVQQSQQFCKTLRRCTAQIQSESIKIKAHAKTINIQSLCAHNAWQCVVIMVRCDFYLCSFSYDDRSKRDQKVGQPHRDLNTLPYVQVLFIFFFSSIRVLCRLLASLVFSFFIADLYVLNRALVCMSKKCGFSTKFSASFICVILSPCSVWRTHVDGVNLYIFI